MQESPLREWIRGVRAALSQLKWRSQGSSAVQSGAYQQSSPLPMAWPHPPPLEPIIRSLVPQLRSSINYFYGQENRCFMSQHRKKTANSHLGRWVQKVWSRQTSCVDWGHGTILRQSSQLSEGRSYMSRVPSSARYRRGGVRQRTCTPPTCPCSLRLGHLDDNDKLLL